MSSSNTTTMISSRQPLLLVLALLPVHLAGAMELTGRFAMLGVTARADADDFGYQTAVGNTLSADQQGLRLMLDEARDNGEWSLHVRAARQHLSGYPGTDTHSSNLFRYRKGAGNWLYETDGITTTAVGYEIDRAVYRQRFEDLTLSLGRQPIDWGSGRFWQPLNVFGAFAPTDLDTDYKPGIDTLSVEAYPGPFSSLTAVYALAPKDEAELSNSGALHYRRGVGAASELALLAGRIVGNRLAGASFESAWKGMGWRVEGLYYQLEDSDEKAVFWIAGLEHQFENGTLLHIEWYDNSRGAQNEAALAGMVNDPLVLTGLQAQLARQVLGLGLSKDISPLLTGSYTLFTSPLRDDERRRHYSLMHQLNLSYSVSNESDLLMSVMLANGKGLSSADTPQSEFGHLPASLTLRLRFYF